MDWRVKVFDSLSLPALILKPDKIIVSANQMFLEKFGISLDEIVGRKCHNFFYRSHEPCPQETCPLPQILANKQGQSILRQVGTEAGEGRWEDRVFSPILNDEGEVEYIIEKVRDVTHVKALEKELTGTKGFLQKVIESSASGIVAVDMKGNILMMNQAGRELLGYTSEEAVNNFTLKDLYLPGVAKEIMKKLRNSGTGGKGKLRCEQVSILNADGIEIPVEVTAAIIYEGDREVATMGIFNDLREQLDAEKRFQEVTKRVAQAEKMASVGQLAAGVAHEINNPLTGILLYANLMLERLAEDDPVREELQCVLEDANRCKDIVKNLLVYSRRASPSKEIFHLNDLVEQSLNLIRDQRLFMNVKVVRGMSEEMMLINADRNQLYQVVINLVLNAVDAMERRGVLTLRTYRDKESGFAYLDVSDTGCGIPIENRSRVFDPFFTTKEPGKGTGLGLSTVYGIVKENGGNIWLKETSPKGTTFTIQLPLYEPEDDAEGS
jgi:two-component system, NtrC family, sensor kinase